MRRIAFVLAALLLAAAPELLAQAITGRVVGHVKDAQGGTLPGATVSLTGKTGTRTTVVDAAGEYRFAAVEPGTYVVSASLSGFRPGQVTNVQVRVGGEAQVDIALAIGGLTESVDVVGESPVVDVSSSSTENTFSQDLLFNLPVRPRNAATDLLNYLPGVNNGSAFGADADTANGLLLDGVDTRDPEGGSAWTFFNYNILEEVQVSGLGANAEYGAYTGAVVNSVTKSGGNKFSGLFDAYYTRASFFADNITDEIAEENPALATPGIINKRLDLTSQLSGPIIKDKLFFFASAQYFEQLEDPVGPRTRRDEWSPRFNGKLTWQPGPNDNLSFMVQYDQYNIIGRNPGGLALVATDEITNREDAPEWVWGVQWRHLFGSRTYIEAKYTGWTGFFDLNPEVEAPGIFNGSTSGYAQSQGWFAYYDRGRHQANLTLSHFADAFGKHDLKFGVEVERSTVRNRYGYVDDIFYYDYSGYPSKQYAAYNYGYDLEGQNQRESFFAQDTWKPTDRLTINAGVRFDWVRGYPSGNSATGSIGDSKVYDAKNLAPRLGVAYDLTGDGKTVLKGTYGRYYEGAFFLTYSAAIPGIEDFVFYGFDPNGEKCGPAGNCFTELDRSPSPPYRVDPDIKHPMTEEFTIGFERALTKDVRFSVTGIKRDDRNIQASVYPDARWAPTTVPNGLLGGNLGVYNWTNRASSEENILLTNPDGFQYLDASGNVLGTARAYRQYRGVMFVLDKRFSERWGGRFSYVYAQAEGTRGNNGFESFGASTLYESASRALVNQEGRLTNDPRHELKLFVTYMVPKIDLSVTANWLTLDGQRYAGFQQFGSSAINFPTSTGRRVLLEERGVRGNEREHLLDLRLEKTFRIGDDRISVYGDIGNVFNASTVQSSIDRYPFQAIAGAGDIPFGAPAGVVRPRNFQLGARWAF